MRADTRRIYNAMLNNMARAYGVEDVALKFAVEVPMEIKMKDKILESSDFLNLITNELVTDTTGEAIDINVTGFRPTRTNTDDKDRSPYMLGGVDGSKWAVKSTEYDIGIKYFKLDQWARYPNFAQKYMDSIYRAIALSRIMVGWYGVSAEIETDGDANPLGQDVNKGWLQILKEEKSENILTDGKVSGEITIGSAAGNDYKNVDALAIDLLQGIPLEHRTGDEIIIIGETLVGDDLNKVATQNGHIISEKSLGITQLANSYGGRPAICVPRFPATGMVVTDPKNLHHYLQESSTRRNAVEESNRNRVVDYISANEAYAIGNTSGITAVDATKVKIKND